MPLLVKLWCMRKPTREKPRLNVSNGVARKPTQTTGASIVVADCGPTKPADSAGTEGPQFDGPGGTRG